MIPKICSSTVHEIIISYLLSVTLLLICWPIFLTQCKINLTFQSQKPPNFKVVLPRVVKMVLNKHPILSISLAYNVISCKKVKRNTQEIKIAVLQTKTCGAHLLRFHRQRHQHEAHGVHFLYILQSQRWRCLGSVSTATTSPASTAINGTEHADPAHKP